MMAHDWTFIIAAYGITFLGCAFLIGDTTTRLYRTRKKLERARHDSPC
jgi:hypothetical protein